MTERVYTEQELQDELRIKIIENTQSHSFKSIERLDSSINLVGSKFDTFKYWVLGLMTIQFGLIIALLEKNNKC
jgi:hypothetical protein